MDSFAGPSPPLSVLALAIHDIAILATVYNDAHSSNHRQAKTTVAQSRMLKLGAADAEDNAMGGGGRMTRPSNSPPECSSSNGPIVAVVRRALAAPRSWSTNFSSSLVPLRMECVFPSVFPPPRPLVPQGFEDIAKDKPRTALSDAVKDHTDLKFTFPFHLSGYLPSSS
ncbi:hypothetical protein FB45DRAFT_1070677 [Roridomyces roridus]|uniref:Uncharacterized protein n=1 Tax=Roridomyces roridus TaxID=1738132 RepID=A0AAD7F909_9AGAR|nr:hypothetical protein FB45DRAFT_1070677 [Roridomyces roridus]